MTQLFEALPHATGGGGRIYAKVVEPDPGVRIGLRLCGSKLVNSLQAVHQNGQPRDERYEMFLIELELFHVDLLAKKRRVILQGACSVNVIEVGSRVSLESRSRRPALGQIPLGRPSLPPFEG